MGGTQAWTRLTLRFVASRAQDEILLTAGSGGSLRGKAWFEGVSLDEVSSADAWPTRDAVQTFGPAYRYPSAGWIYLYTFSKSAVGLCSLSAISGLYFNTNIVN